MTAIIGYRDISGEIILAADCRISWPVNGAIEVIHEDHLQKIYVVNDHVLIAFATNDLRKVEKLLVKLQKYRWLPKVKTISGAQRLYRRQRSLDRLLRKEALALDARTHFLVALMDEAQPLLNSLSYYTFRSGIFCREAVLPGKYRVLGSVTDEAQYDRFIAEVTERAFGPLRVENVELRSLLLKNHFAVFVQSLPTEWHSVGQLLLAIYSDNGNCLLPTFGTKIIMPTGVVVDIELSYDPVTRVAYQHNLATRESVPVSIITGASLRKSPSQSKPFNIGL